MRSRSTGATISISRCLSPASPEPTSALRSSSPKLPLTQSQYGATLGGPLARNKTFLFSNFEQSRRNTAGLVTIAPANAAAINQVLGRQVVHTGQYPTGYDSTEYFARADHQLDA